VRHSYLASLPLELRIPSSVSRKSLGLAHTISERGYSRPTAQVPGLRFSKRFCATHKRLASPFRHSSARRQHDSSRHTATSASARCTRSSTSAGNISPFHSIATSACRPRRTRESSGLCGRSSGCEALSTSSGRGLPRKRDTPINPISCVTFGAWEPQARLSISGGLRPMETRCSRRQGNKSSRRARGSARSFGKETWRSLWAVSFGEA